jgi:hypothetical protein
MKPRQTAILAAAVILPVLVLLWFRDTQAPSASGERQTASPVHRERSSVADRTTVARPAPGRAKDFQSFSEKAMSPEGVKLTPEEMENYLGLRNRDVESLLVVFRMTLDKALVDEALEKAPNDPEVLLCALRISQKPEDRLKLIESFKQNDPGNGLGNCLAARALLDMGRDQEAIAELSQSAGKPIDSFLVKSCQSAEEAFLSAGYSPLESKAAALFGANSPELVKLAGPIWKKLETLRLGYESAGNDPDAQSLRDIQTRIGQSLQQNSTTLESVIGIAYEKNAWQGLDSPEALAHLQELALRKDAVVGRSKQMEELRKDAAVPDSDWLLYLDRVKIFGEHAANDWMLQKYPGR